MEHRLLIDVECDLSPCPLLDEVKHHARSNLTEPSTIRPSRNGDGGHGRSDRRRLHSSAIRWVSRRPADSTGWRPIDQNGGRKSAVGATQRSTTEFKAARGSEKEIRLGCGRLGATGRRPNHAGFRAVRFVTADGAGEWTPE